MGIFSKKSTDPIKQYLEVEKQKEGLEAARKGVMADILEIEDAGGGGKIAECKGRLKEIDMEIEILAAKLADMEKRMIGAKLAELQQIKADYPQKLKELQAEQAAGIERGLKLLAEGMLLIESYTPLKDDRFVELVFKKSPFGFELPESMQLAVGRARGIFNFRQHEIQEQEAVALSFPERLQELKSIRRCSLDLEARTIVLNAIGRRRKEVL